MKNDKKEPFLDRVFLHSKNADERLFDMILRIITFIVLIIILWLYADIAHAKADSLDIFDYIVPDNEQYSLSPFWFNDDYWRMSQTFSDIPYNSNYQLPLVSWKNMKVTDRMDFDNYQFVMCCNSGSGGYESIFTLFIPKDVHVALLDSQRLYFMEECDCPYVWTDFSHQNVTSYYTYNTTHFSSGLVNFSSSNIISSGSLTFFFGNIPYLKGSNVDAPTYFENGNDLYTCYNANYFMYDDLCLLPYEEVESDLNHLYLKDYSIGLTSADFLLDSNLIISAKWDNWVEKYISHYKMVIVYQVDYNGEPWSRMDVTPPVEQPLHWMVTDTVPLAKFSSYYSIGIRDIFSRMGVNDESATAICNALQNSGAIIATSNGSTTVQDVLNGLSAEFKVATNGVGVSSGVNLGVLYAYLHEQLDTLHAGESTVFIDDFRLTVNFHLVSDRLSVGDTSGLGGAEFDFLNGTTDYSYDILNNNNEWTEPNKPNINNETANTNSSSGDIVNSNIAYGGNASSNVGDINITTGNGYKDTELHQLTNQDIVNNHLKIITVIEDLKYCFHQFAEANNHNSFMQMIIDDYGQIPGVEYIATSIIILCGVCILIFIIKIAF